MKTLSLWEKLTGSRKLASLRRPDFELSVGTVQNVAYEAAAGRAQWYPPIMLGAETVRDRLFREDYVRSAIDLMQNLSADDYTTYLVEFLSEGRRRFGAEWRYADIVTTLLCLSELLQPKHYLEIGVRRGRSVAAVVRNNPQCNLYLFDMWIAHYAGMENPGPDFVRQELAALGHSGKAIFVDGDSHATLPDFFAQNTDLRFDLITVDGDHSTEGAVQDLCDVLPRLNLGGAVVLDDICHPLHPELTKVWNELVASDPRFSSFTYTDTGYGVGFGIRKH